VEKISGLADAKNHEMCYTMWRAEGIVKVSLNIMQGQDRQLRSKRILYDEEERGSEKAIT
jgi:hypothetical protein